MIIDVFFYFCPPCALCICLLSKICDPKIPNDAADARSEPLQHPDDRISPAQDAVLRVQSRIVTAISDGKEKTVLSRLLVSSNQIGCLLGKGGAIIAEMRKLSRAHIRILGKDQIPKCASENEEVIHVSTCGISCSCYILTDIVLTMLAFRFR